MFSYLTFGCGSENRLTPTIGGGVPNSSSVTKTTSSPVTKGQPFG
jgi:hypothetical protein